MPKSPEEMAAAMVRNLEEKTGKPLDHWLAVVRESGIEKHGQIVKHLKTEHGMTHGYANLVAHQAKDAPWEKPADDLVGAQYAGAKAGLRPIHDALMKAANALGEDVEVAPKKTYVSLRGPKRQFALVQPSTKTRVDLGLRLDGVKAKGRLEDAGRWNSMVTHRVRLESAKDVNAEVKRWLKQAYADS